VGERDESAERFLEVIGDLENDMERILGWLNGMRRIASQWEDSDYRIVGALDACIYTASEMKSRLRELREVLTK